MNESIVKKEFSRRYSNLKFSYFIFENHESFNNEISSAMFPIKRNLSIGTIFVNILNNKNYLYNSLSNLINKIVTFSSFDSIANFLTEFYTELKDYEYFQPVFFCLRDMLYSYIRSISNPSAQISHLEDLISKSKQIQNDNNLLKLIYPDLTSAEAIEVINKDISYYQEQIKNFDSTSDNWKINEIAIIFSKYIMNIKSTIENFCTYLNTNHDDVKKYLLWDMYIPNSTYNYGVFDDEDQAIYIQPAFEYNHFENTNSLDKLIPLRKYQISEFIELLNLFIDLYLQKKFIINKCEYCGKYFIPDNRSDEKYCSNPCPDAPSKTCKDYASKKNYAEKQKSDIINHEDYNTRQFFRMRIKRSKSEKEKYFYERNFETYKINYPKKRKKFENTKLSEDEFANWIVSQKVPFNK